MALSDVRVPALAPEFAGSVAAEVRPRRTLRRIGFAVEWMRTSAKRSALAAVVAVAAVVSAWSLYRTTARDGDSVALGGLTAGAELLVGDIVARSDDSLTARALTEQLRTHLGASPAVRVVSRADMAQSLVRMQQPRTTLIDESVAREMAARDGYEALLTTQLNPVGAGFVLSAHLSAVSGRELAAASESATRPDSLIPALDRLARSLRSQLGESRQALVEIPPLQQVTTWSIRALELFSQAQVVSHVSQGRGQQPPEMFALLHEALAIDSTFAMAHRRLGAALGNLGLVQEAMEEFRAAERFSDRLTEAERRMALVSLHLNLGDYDRTLTEATALLRLDPGSLFAQNWLGILYFSFGKYDIAERHIPTIASTADAPFLSHVRTYQGRGAEALEFARAYHGRYVDSSGTLALKRARNRLAIFHSAQAAYDSAIFYAAPRDVSDSGSPQILAASRFARGQVRQAMAIQKLRLFNTDDEIRGPRRTTVDSYTALAQLLITTERAGANQRLDRVLADTIYRNLDPANRHIRPVLALAVAGRAADARRELTEIERGSSADVLRARFRDLDMARGAVALAEGHPQLAIEALKRAGASTHWGSFDTCRVCTLPWLGRAYEDVGQPDSATATYERYLSTGDSYRVLSDGAWRALVLRRLGELHAQRGDSALAVRRLAEFVDLWKDADRELQPEVDNARRRLAVLRGTIVADGGRASVRAAAVKQ